MSAPTLPDLREAADLLARKQPERAVTLLQTLTHQLPTYAAAHVLLARAYEFADDWEGALGAWQQANFLLPSSARVREGMRQAMRSVYEPSTQGDSAPRPVEPTATVPAPQPTPPVTPGAEHAAPPAPPPTPQPAQPAAREPELPEAAPSWHRAASTSPGFPVPFRLGERARAPEAPTPDAPEEPRFIPPPSWLDADTFSAPSAVPSAPPAPEPPRTPPPPVSDTTPTRLLPAAPQAPAASPSFEQPETDLPDGWSAPPLERFDALDDLIDALDGARIMPRADLDELPTPDLEQDIGEVVSPTLARIYVTQGQFAEAARIYDKLAAQQPNRADEFRTRAAEARAQA